MSAATDLQRYTTSCAERRLCDACVIEYSGPIRAVSQLLWSEKDREEWFSLRENHEKPIASVYTNCETALERRLQRPREIISIESIEAAFFICRRASSNQESSL